MTLCFCDSNAAIINSQFSLLELYKE